MNDTNNDGLLPVRELLLTDTATNSTTTNNNNSSCKTLEPNSNALESLCLLRDSNPILSQKWTCSTNKNNSNWAVLIQLDEKGNIIEMDLGGLLRLRHMKNIIPSFGLMTQLTSLNLAGTALDVKQDIQSILQALLQAKSPLNKLFLGGLGITDDDVMILAPYLQSFVQYSLDRLDLRYNQIGPNGMLHFYNIIFNSTKKNQNHLTKLYMEGNRLGNDGIMTLAKVLASSSCSCQLKELYLGDNQIGPQGATMLANALSTNTTVTKIYLEGNQIGPTGAMAFIDILETKQNTSLQNLYVDNNNLGKEIATRLAKALNNNSNYERSIIGDF